MILLGLPVLICLFITQAAATAQTKMPSPVSSQQKAVFDLDWDVVPDASGYEIELVPAVGGKPIRSACPTNKFSAEVPVGIYKVKIRSKESSTGIYGVWSSPIEVDVAAKTIAQILPKDNSEFLTEKNNFTSVNFQWTPVSGATWYLLKIWSTDETKAKTFKVKRSKVSVRLSGSKDYSWEVTFETPSTISYQYLTPRRKFLVKGPQLGQPMLDAIELPEVTRASWANVAGAENYNFKISHRSLDETEWRDLLNKPKLQENKINFPKLRPGVYRVEVSAISRLRQESTSDSIEFTVKPTREEIIETLRLALHPSHPLDSSKK